VNQLRGSDAQTSGCGRIPETWVTPKERLIQVSLVEPMGTIVIDGRNVSAILNEHIEGPVEDVSRQNDEASSAR
jgi:hypothetical protein